jgi:membrane-bound lytic murein transglycosylase F
VRLISTICLGLLLVTCQPPPTLLEQILDEGTLRVVSRNSPTTYYFGPEGPVGPEFDLAKGFADQLGVRLDMTATDSIAELLEAVASGRAHIAAAGLTATTDRWDGVTFGPVYRHVTEVLVYRSGQRKPRKISDLYGGHLEVAAHSSHVRTLENLRHEHPDLTWLEHPSAAQDELLERVASGEADFTVIDSTSFDASRFFYPERDGIDDSLRRQAKMFFATDDARNLITAIDQRYLQPIEDFDYVGVRTFLRHVDSRLPLYKDIFREAADIIDVDWRLLAAVGYQESHWNPEAVSPTLAAVGYQESHWNPEAVSPTGVKGIMMLTRDTAKMMGVADRENARESIIGGARYLARVKRKIPDRIPEPDRTWLTLAAYNIGFGHLEDARIITEIQEGDPDSWEEVRANLPLLTQKKWYSRVKRGYARGLAPVHYVDNVRSYYEALIWLTSGEFAEPVSVDAQADDPAVDDAA